MSSDEKIDIFNSKTIKSFLDQLYKDKLVVRIWQKIEETKSYTFGRIINYRHQDEEIKLEIKDADMRFDLNRDVFFHTAFKETIFKTTITKAHKNTISVKRPSLVKIRDARSEERKSFGIASYQFAEIILPNGEENKVQVLDSSSNGLGVMVSRAVFSALAKGDHLSICNSSVEDHIGKIAIVRSLSPIDKVLSSEASFRVGLEIVG